MDRVLIGKILTITIALLLVFQTSMLPVFADNDPPPTQSSLAKLIQDCQKQKNPDKTCTLLGLVQQIQQKSSSEIFTGNGVPSNTLGNNGDFYLDNASGNYYQKVSNVWTLLGNLKGPAGPQGLPGKNGINGTNGATGPAGPTGSQGPAGSQIYTGALTPSNTLGNNGDFYVNTLTGAYFLKVSGAWVLQASLLAGPQGPAGSQIYTGNGAPSGTLGVNNDFYLDVASGNYYQKVLGTWSQQGNLKGPTGPTGATGPTGPPGSQIYIGSGPPGSSLGTTNDFYLDNGTGTYYQKKTGGWAIEGMLTGSVSSGVITALQNQINSLNSTVTTLKGNATTLNQQLQFTQLNSAAFGLISYWKFDGNTNDFSGLGNNGAVTGTSTYVTGEVGQAFSFDGSTYITTGTSSVLNFERTQPITISVWEKTTISGFLPMMSKFQSVSTGWYFALSGNGLLFQEANINNVNDFVSSCGNNTPNSLLDGNWHNVMVTYDGSSNANGVKFYIDGKLQTTTVARNNLSSSITNAAPVTIGSLDVVPHNPLIGQLDDLRIYNNALSATQVSVLFSNHT